MFEIRFIWGEYLIHYSILGMEFPIKTLFEEEKGQIVGKRRGFGDRGKKRICIKGKGMERMGDLFSSPFIIILMKL
jgi:hypothetical protein